MGGGTEANRRKVEVVHLHLSYLPKQNRPESPSTKQQGIYACCEERAGVDIECITGWEHIFQNLKRDPSSVSCAEKLSAGHGKVCATGLTHSLS